MSTEARVVVVGAGGHAKVVMDALMSSDPALAACFADDCTERVGLELLGRRVEAAPRQLVRAGVKFHVAIGNNQVRQTLQWELQQQGGGALSVIHPRACVSRHAALGDGVFVAAGGVAAPSSRVGDGVIINHGAVVDHDCVVGAFTHVAPHATLGGGVSLGRFVTIGAGATVLPGVHVGDGAIIGAGAVVVRSVPSGAVFYGVPARQARKEEN